MASQDHGETELKNSVKTPRRSAHEFSLISPFFELSLTFPVLPNSKVFLGFSKPGPYLNHTALFLIE